MSIQDIVTRRVFLVSLALSGLGCVDSRRPMGPGAVASVASQSPARPFYYYRGRRIELIQEYDKLVVKGPAAVEDARAAVTGLPSRFLDARWLSGGHALLSFAGVSDEASFATIIGRLRSTGRFSFVQPSYRMVDDNRPVQFLDHLDVQFKAEASAAEIASLLGGLGLEVIRPPRPDSGFFAYRLRYNSTIDDPLSIAAFLDRHPLVSWADPVT